MRHRIFLTLLITSISILGKAQSSSIAFQPASQGIDAVVISNAPSTNYGGNTTLSAEATAAAVKTRGLIKFDLTSIPREAIIISASLTLYGISHSGTNPSLLRQNTSAWAEESVNWNLSPTNTTTGQLILAQSAVATQNYVLDVKAFVQGMVNVPASNFGWTLLKQNETAVGALVFGSSDHASGSLRPRLTVTYCMPMTVSAFMTPATGASNADGALNVTVTGGVPPYTYTWNDGSNTKDIFNKLPGVYVLTVTDNAANQVRKNLIIAAENTSMTFNIAPDGLAGKDALVQSMSNGTLQDNNYKDNTLFKAEKGTSTLWFITEGFLEFDVSSIPSNVIISDATLTLYGTGGHNSSYRPNTCYLLENTGSWNESTLTWNTRPSYNTFVATTLAATTGASDNRIVPVTAQVQKWIQNPSSNFGWRLALTDEATNNYAYMVFGSSDHATAGLRPNLAITVSMPVATDAQRNWTLEETFDQSGNVLASSKVYTDDLGRTTQALSKDANGDVFASQTIYDAYGRPAINTLPAYAGNTLTYKTNLMLNTQGTEYNYTNFDVAGKITTPDAVQVGLTNTTGTYYSNLNTLDTWQATATNPYSRTQYLADPSGAAKTVNGADNAFNATSGRDVRNYSMVCGSDELKFILGTGNSYKVKTTVGSPLVSTPIVASAFLKATKSITTSPDNKPVISYSVGDKVIATCMSGLSSPDNCTMNTVINAMDWYATQSTDIHVPDASKSSLTFPLPTYRGYFSSDHSTTTQYTTLATEINYVITDQTTETVLQTPADYSINASTRALTFSTTYLAAKAGKPLFLRIRVVYTPAFVSKFDGVTAPYNTVPQATVQYNLDYGRWSVNYYDLAGNVRKTVSAKGMNCSSPGTVSMATTYDYSHLGQLVAQQSPDEGLVEYAYDADGKLRFMQNPEQRLNKRFSYVNYDLNERQTEAGEFSNVSGSGANGVYFQNYYNAYTAPYSGNVSSATLVDNIDGLYDAYCNDATFTSYETLSAADDIPSGYAYASQYAGNYKNGQVSKTWNANTTTWYKYDAAGRMLAGIKQIKDADYVSFTASANAQIKTIENTYDPYFGYVTNSYYQKNVTNEYAEHRFSFDANKRLSGVSFVAGSAGTPLAISGLSYDKLGRIKRQVIGPDLQGVDYVYTLGGALKAMNHPSLDYTKDRGQDLRNYSDVTAGVKQDLFGEILEYYPGDYTRAGTSIEANTNGLYNGQIYGSRYKTRNDVNGTITGADYINYPSGPQLVTTTNYGQQELANRYTYDNFGQLASSIFGTFNNTTNTFTGRTDYKEFGVTNNSIGYDENGNITRLQRNSYDVSTNNPQLLDDLTYTYATNTNKHLRVADAATNSFASSFNYKNQTAGSPINFLYDGNGRMAASMDENISAITYYPNGQIKQTTFANGNRTSYFYGDMGQKYKTTYYNAATTATKYTWYIGDAVYEYVSSVGSFNLKEYSIGGAGRLGVYKQDVTGVAIATGHAEYQLTDHLGNVRVTFRQGTGTNLDVLSKADYYAFGGQMPGRLWQQGGGDYRYGYQGQEKTQDDGTWDQFELRSLNHDLGRWTSPDPYGQFNSPYISMGNDPITNVDPNGGYINMSNEGVAQRNSFMRQLAQDRFNQQGRYSYAYLYPRYQDALSELMRNNQSGGISFMQGLLKLNNEYLGLGLASTCLSSGRDFASQNAIINNQNLFLSLIDQNGEGSTMAQAKAGLPGLSAWFTSKPSDRSSLALRSGVYELYELVSAFVYRRQIGLRDNVINRETDDFITGYEYNFRTSDGKTFHSYINTFSQNSGGDLKDPQSGGITNWYGPAGKVNASFGAAASAVEAVKGSFRMTNGIKNGSSLSLKYYSSGWGGGSRARIKTYNISKVGGMLGKLSFGLGVAMDVVGIQAYYKNPNSPNAVHPTKAAINTGMGVYGLYVNPVIGASYFLMDNFYPNGINAFIQDGTSSQNSYNNLVPPVNGKPHFYIAPWGGQKL